jgi:hypothetical protein
VVNVPEVIDQLRDVVAHGIGYPPPVDTVRSRTAPRRLRPRVVPIAIVAATLVAVLGVTVAHDNRPAGKQLPPASQRLSVHCMCSSSLIPLGWVAVAWGDAQVTVPGSWTVLLESAYCSTTGPGWVELGPVEFALGCGAAPGPVPKPSASIQPSTMTNLSHFGQVTTVNGFPIAWNSSDGQWAYLVPALHVEITVTGSPTGDLARQIVDTLTYSPRAVALQSGTPPPVPTGWQKLRFDGLGLSLPPADIYVVKRTNQYPVDTCSLTGAAMPRSLAILDSDETRVPPPSCPDFSVNAGSVFGAAGSGVEVDRRLGASSDEPQSLLTCFALHGLHMCPYASPGYDILALRVSGGSVSTPMLVQIGLSGSGETARTILDSLRSG